MSRLLRSATLTLLLAVITGSLLSPLRVHAADRLQDIPDDRPIIIVIDPGHGGKNLGTVEGGQDEKYMTMTTAMAMYQELCLYDNVEVYLTRTEDKDMIIKDRAEFAKSVNADFLFSIHYNASEEHALFGAEIWIPSAAPFNAYGYQFGYEFLAQLQERGLFIRGIKTRLGDNGDYYGIIRETAALDIPAVILEHCHVDEARDADYCDSEEDLIQFGREDATAVAKYFGLKSSALNVDYSDYQLAEVDDKVPVSITLRDDTPPEICLLEFADADYGQGILSLTVSAADYDTPLLYYDYSIDGGLTYSPRTAWPGSNALDNSYEDTFTLSLLIPDGVKPSVIIRAYNLFDLFTESSPYDSPETFLYTREASPEESAGEEAQEALPLESREESADSAVPAVSDNTEAGQETSFVTFLKICLAIVFALFVLLFISQIIAGGRKKRRMRQHKNDAGASRNQHR